MYSENRIINKDSEAQIKPLNNGALSSICIAVRISSSANSGLRSSVNLSPKSQKRSKILRLSVDHQHLITIYHQIVKF